MSSVIVRSFHNVYNKRNETEYAFGVFILWSMTTMDDLFYYHFCRHFFPRLFYFLFRNFIFVINHIERSLDMAALIYFIDSCLRISINKQRIISLFSSVFCLRLPHISVSHTLQFMKHATHTRAHAHTLSLFHSVLIFRFLSYFHIVSFHLNWHQQVVYLFSCCRFFLSLLIKYFTSLRMYIILRSLHTIQK